MQDHKFVKSKDFPRACAICEYGKKYHTEDILEKTDSKPSSSTGEYADRPLLNSKTGESVMLHTLLAKEIQEARDNAYQEGAKVQAEMDAGLIEKARREVVEEIKKKLPTHPGKMLSRTELKKVLEKLK